MFYILIHTLFFDKINKLAPDQPMQEQPEIPQQQEPPRQIEYKLLELIFLTKSDVVQLILKDNHKSSFLTRCWNTIVPFMPVRLANCTGVKNVSVGEYNFSASSERTAKVRPCD